MVSQPGGKHRLEGDMNLIAHFEVEARALLCRLKQVRPFVSSIPMLATAAISRQAQDHIHNLLQAGKARLRHNIHSFIHISARNPHLSTDHKQARFAVLKLQFNALLDQLDIFADALTQRSEWETGVWLAGLDALAEDALGVVPKTYVLPPLICYLDRGHGAAIRRARTRLPGGVANPVAVIRVPRERMISTGISASLIHEVGHQAAALLGLVNSLRQQIRQQKAHTESVWQLFDRWISEIIADLWAVAILGVSATAGLMGVVSLPRYFVFRTAADDPHPFPWIRVILSASFGDALYPDPQWQRLMRQWQALYPLDQLRPEQRKLILTLLDHLPDFIAMVCAHRCEQLAGRSLRELFPLSSRQPYELRKHFDQWQQRPDLAKHAKPSLFFAVIGQARADHRISPERESDWVHDILRHWAFLRTK